MAKVKEAEFSPDENMLLMIMEAAPLNTAAVILSSYVQDFGPISEDLGEAVRKVLADKQVET